MEDNFTIAEKKNTKETPKIKPNVRTMKSDAQEYIDKYKVSLVDIAALANRTSGKKNKKINWPLVTVGLILISSIIVFALVIFQKKQTNSNVKINRGVIPSFITYDGQEKILLTNKTNAKKFNVILKNALTKEDILIGDIIDLVIIDESGVVGVKSFFDNLNISPPSNVSEFLDNRFMLGFYTERRNWPFLIFKINSYDHAFAGMIEWEKFILNDLANLFSIPKDNLDQSFEDKVIKNYDTRVSIDTNGEVTLIYSFINKETLVIASQKLTFEEVIKRLTLSQD